MPALGAVGGAIVGSFLATLCIRWPEGRQAMTGRSSCDHCGRALRVWELVPVLSGAISGEKCRSCGGRIAPLHFALEAGAGALAGIALLLQPNLTGVALALLWLLLIALAVLDARHFWLPDTLNAVLAVAGLLLGGLATGATLADRLIGGGSGFLALALIALAYSRLRGRDGLGAGDPKMLGAIGLWTGWAPLPAILILASLTGLAIALVQQRSASERMPFGALLAVAAILWTAIAAARAAGF
ncbi:MAG: prepilin peptidase [Alphaproteobacteria bacterium]